VQSSRTASEHLGRAHFAHYISYILFSILQQMASGFKMIYELGYSLTQSQASFYKPHAYWSHWDFVNSDNENNTRNPAYKPVVSSVSGSLNN